jgi:hypothetical protein
VHFKQYGKTFQLRIESAADLKDALELDESHWVATSAPTNVFRCDPDFIAMLDPDNSKRILSGELKKAIAWLLAVLSNHSGLPKRTNHIPLTAINQSSTEGTDIYKSAKYILQSIKPDADTISLKLVRQFISRQKQQPLNGDGILVPSATSNPKTEQLINDIIATVGSDTDASGVPGITEEKILDFRKEVADCIAWRELANDQNSQSNVLPFGSETKSMHKVLLQHADKVELFFSQCKAIRFEPNLMPQEPCKEQPLTSAGFSDKKSISDCLQQLPLAKPNANQLLPLDSADINPLYADWIEELKQKILIPILGSIPPTLSANAWQQIKNEFTPYTNYLTSQKGKAVASMSDQQLQTYLRDDTYCDVMKLIKADKAVADQLKAIHEVERLTLYHQHLLRFANNFICFKELYHPPIKAMFEEGSVQIDGRWFDLALRVDNIAQHSAIAKSSNIFVLYLEVTDSSNNNKFTIAVPATSGSKGNLGIGKRGIFFDWKNREHNATVIKIIDNPISMSEALAAPFIRLWEFVLGKIEAMSSTLEKKLQKNTDAILQAQPKTSAPQNPAANGPAGMLVGLSLSAAAIGSAFAFITKTLSGLNSTQLLAGLFGAAAVVAIPVSLIAALKLRRQDLSSLLEGCGWSINARMRFDRAQRRSFTRRVPYPLAATGTPQRHWLRTAIITLGSIAILTLLIHSCHSKCINAEPPAPAMPTSHPSGSSEL